MRAKPVRFWIKLGAGIEMDHMLRRCAVNGISPAELGLVSASCSRRERCDSFVCF